MDQAEEQPPGQLLLVRCELVVDLARAGRHRAVDAADVVIVGNRQPSTLALRPGGVQRVRQQRQRASVMCPLA